MLACMMMNLVVIRFWAKTVCSFPSRNDLSNFSFLFDQKHMVIFPSSFSCQVRTWKQPPSLLRKITYMYAYVEPTATWHMNMYTLLISSSDVQANVPAYSALCTSLSSFLEEQSQHTKEWKFRRRLPHTYTIISYCLHVTRQRTVQFVHASNNNTCGCWCLRFRVTCCCCCTENSIQQRALVIVDNSRAHAQQRFRFDDRFRQRRRRYHRISPCVICKLCISWKETQEWNLQQKEKNLHKDVLSFTNITVLTHVRMRKDTAITITSREMRSIQ